MNEQTPHSKILPAGCRPRQPPISCSGSSSRFFVLFLIWASFTKLDRSVRGQGRVIASSHMQVISNLEGGVVKEILVRTGQQVQKGQELIRLDRTHRGRSSAAAQLSVNALAGQGRPAHSPRWPGARRLIRPAQRSRGRPTRFPDRAVAATPRGWRSWRASPTPAMHASARRAESIQEAQGAYQARVPRATPSATSSS